MYEIGISYLRQIEDQSGPGDDDPYVIVFAADLADTGLIPIPSARCWLHGPWEIENVVGFPLTAMCWGFDGKPRDIDDANNPLIVVGLMESDHDDDPPDFANGVRVGTHGLVMAALAGYIVDLNAGKLDLATLRQNVIDDMRGALDVFKKGDIEADERLGDVQILTITADDLVKAQNSIVKKALSFVSEDEDSNYEISFNIGTGVGSVSQGLSVAGPTDRYAALWVKESGPEWVARHRMTSQEYQHESDSLTRKGYRLTHISGYNCAGKPHFAAVWDKTAGPAWLAKHNLTAAQYQAEFERQAKEGYRLKQVSGYRGNGQDLYAAIWVKETGPAWLARHRMTSERFQMEFNALAQQGYRLVDVSGYGIANKDRYAAIWSKQKGNAWVARHGLSSAQYQKEFNHWTKEGYRLKHVSGYCVGGRRRFAAIWEHSTGPACVARHDLTSDQYQAEFNKYVSQGYRLACVSGY